jgi:hypothetical protein
MKTDSMYLVDSFASVKSGQPFRLFPFGKVVKNGKERFITPELAAQFQLPHFKPAIKLGSHADETPAGGFITGLIVKDDGLYGLPEWNEAGLEAQKNGAYRYQSPEVIWEGAGFENPDTGERIPAPLVVGAALLHMPHLGEKAALYSVETKQEVDKMSDTVTIPTSMFDKFMAFFEKPDEPATEPPKDDGKVDEFAAVQKERDELAAKVEAFEAAQNRQAAVEKYTAALKETKLAEDAELVEILIGLDAETAQKLVKKFSALSAQIDESNLTSEKGADGDGAKEDENFNSAVLAYAKEKEMDYFAAAQKVAVEKPELYKAYLEGGK